MVCKEEWVVYNLHECDQVGCITDEDWEDMMESGDIYGQLCNEMARFPNYKAADIYAKSQAKRLNYEYKGQ
jgi:hypothetical protein